MSSFRPDPSLIGPDGYLKDTPDAKKFKEEVKKFNEKLYTPEVNSEQEVTAGFGGNKTLMLVVGLGILYFVGKKQKWF